MKLIVGLGNPGNKYDKTRHNVGFMFIDHYAKEKKCMDYKEKFHGLLTSFFAGEEQVYLFKPLTYMNLSGQAILEISQYYHIPHQDILVVYDDKDLPFASLRLRVKGNPGSHNGMKNITMLLNDTSFYRIRVGIGCPSNGMDMVDFVLSKFNKEEIELLNKSFVDVAKSCDLFISNKFDLAMNRYNVRKSDEK